MTLLAPRIGNDVSCVTQIIDDLPFAWQAQYLGQVECDFFVAGAALRDILGDSRSAKCCILQYKIVAKIARGRSPKRRVRDDNFMLGLSSDMFGLSSDYRRIVFLLAEAIQGFCAEIMNSEFRGRRSIW